MIEIVDAEGASDVEELGGVITSVASRELHLLRIILQAQDVALSRHNEALRPTLEASRAMMADLTAQAREWRREAVKAAESADEVRERLSRAIDKHNAGDEKGLVDEIEQVMRVVKLVQPMLTAGRPPAPAPRPPASNGANGTPAPAAPAPAAAPIKTS